MAKYDVNDYEIKIAEIAHEIRNPLQLIRANIQYIELSDETRKNRKNYDVIYREIDRLTEILSGLNGEHCRAGLLMQSFNITALIDEVVIMFEKVLELAGITLDVIVCENDLKVSADYDKLKQVMINIVQNAKESIEDSVEKGKGKIEIRVFEENKLVNIQITDNGAGISEKDLHMVGTPFFTRKKRGNGLGVSISREIIERHKGSFRLDGTENEGARVLITLGSVSGGINDAI